MASLARAASRPSSGRSRDAVHNDAPAPLLYTLSFDCPFAWPASPSYLPKDASNASMNGHPQTNGTAAAVNGVQVVSGPSSRSASIGFGQEADATMTLSNSETYDTNGLMEDATEIHNGVAGSSRIEEASASPAPLPATLRPLYLECLYSSGQDKSKGSTRLLQALQAGAYTQVPGVGRTNTHADNLELSIDEAGIQSLIPLLLDLRAIDVKWHNQLPAVVGHWQDESEGAMNHAREPISVLQDLQPDELQALQLAHKAWQSPTTDIEGEVKPMLGRTDWLSGLEVIEIELQIVLLLHLLSLLPAPLLSARQDRRHRNRSQQGDPATRHAADWLSGMHSASEQVHSGQTPRKRKLPSSAAVVSTPRLELPKVDAQAEANAKLYKSSAIRLDELTDSLAIHQAVGGIGASLADLWADSTDQKGKGKEDDLDPYQRFWLTLEESFAAYLPEDMLSGCHSKFFTSSSLDVSLRPTDREDAEEAGLSNKHIRPVQGLRKAAPSPSHHTTPNLQELARSVQLAQEEAKRTRIPASPTLAKLLAADRAREEAQAMRDAQSRLQLAGIAEEDEDVPRSPTEADEVDTSWLMPPADADPSVAFGQARPPVVRSTLARSSSTSAVTSAMAAPSGPLKGLSRSRSAIVNGPAHPSKNLFKTVEVKFGTVKSNSSLEAIKPKKKAGFTSMAIVNKPAPAGEEERTNKRKLASPKRNVSASEKAKGRTLVLATPAKERVKVKKKAVMSPFVRPPTVQTAVAHEEEDWDEMDLLRSAREERVKGQERVVLVGETPHKRE